MPTEATLTQRPLGCVILARACWVAGFVVLSHSVPWRWLQWITSECVLRLSDLLGMPASRVSLDTLRINGQLFEYVTSCTFIDVFMGTVPLIWNPRSSTRANALVLTFWAAGLFTFNVLRLVLAQCLFGRGYSWAISDQVLGGISYFLVWLLLWQRRSRQLFPAQAGIFEQPPRLWILASSWFHRGGEPSRPDLRACRSVSASATRCWRCWPCPQQRPHSGCVAARCILHPATVTLSVRHKIQNWDHSKKQFRPR